MSLSEQMEQTYRTASGQGMDEATVITLVFNRHARGEIQRRVRAQGNETVSAILNELEAAWVRFARACAPE